jgi:hypothetical protein
LLISILSQITALHAHYKAPELSILGIHRIPPIEMKVPEPMPNEKTTQIVAKDKARGDLG